MPRQKLSIIVPVYFNEESLSLLHNELQKLESELDKKDMDLELIFVDDGSLDKSLEELAKIKKTRPETVIIKLTRNFGAVSASSTAFQYVTGDCFLVLAADLQDPPAQVLKMVNEWIKGHKFVISRREERKDPLLTRMFASIFYFLLRRLVFSDYPKGGFDLMLADKQILPFLKRLYGNINFTTYAYWLGYKPKVLSYVREERKYGRSRWTFRKKVNFFLDNMTGFSVGLIRVVAGFGIIVSMFSFFYGLYILFSAIVLKTKVPGFATLVIIISFSTSVILTVLSIISEYIWRIFIKAYDQPTSVIDEIYKN